MDMFSPLPPAAPLGFTASPLDRLAHRRDDAAWLADALDQPDTGICVLSGESVVLQKGGRRAPWNPLFSAREVRTFGEPVEVAFLGGGPDGLRFAYHYGPELGRTIAGAPIADTLAASLQQGRREGGDSPFFATDLRTIAIQGLVDGAEMPTLAEGKALMNWHARHRFCSNCGQTTHVSQSGWRRDCSACNAQHFPRTDPVVIMVAVDGDRCLLGRQERFPPGMVSALAGFMEPGETIAEAVRREILEEAGIKTGAVRYLADQPWPFPSSLMIGCIAQATSRDIVVDHNELQDARWYSREDCRQMLTRSHPQGLFCPPPYAIAHHLIRAFAEGMTAE